eukprot:TRINITY_DN7125_c0_g2_i1.p1 TRINITY_DN7125_c0_g2~~TRINITY_DN7125_c0_g2_i1.p1  ORF type:complete len:191 (-),score=24.17 TRINITY_DN7125_c0_g2_i1:137-709(-)
MKRFKIVKFGTDFGLSVVDGEVKIESPAPCEWTVENVAIPSDKLETMKHLGIPEFARFRFVYSEAGLHHGGGGTPMVLSVHSGKPPTIELVHHADIKPGSVEWYLVRLHEHEHEGFLLHHETHGKIEPADLVGIWNGSVELASESDFTWQILTADGESLEYPGLPEASLRIAQAEERAEQDLRLAAAAGS